LCYYHYHHGYTTNTSRYGTNSTFLSIGGVAVAIVVVVHSSPLAPHTIIIGPMAGGIGGVAVAIVAVFIIVIFIR
jgi:hypothetical protein